MDVAVSELTLNKLVENGVGYSDIEFSSYVAVAS